MSGKPKQGIDFAGWNTDIFENDIKIDELIDAQGPTGFYIYFWLCQKAYASDGYFYRWSYANAATTARKMAGRIRSETVKATVGTCCQVGLFDKRLLECEGILTSRGIQRRFIAAIQKRNYRAVDRRFWLLDEPETAAGKIVFLKEDFPDVGDSRTVNYHVLPENGHVLTEDAPKSKVKESKVKESKEYGGRARTREDELRRLLIPSREEVRAFAKERNSKSDPDRFFDWYEAGNWRDGNGELVRNWKQKFMTWERLDDGRSENGDPGHSKAGAEREFHVRYDNQPR